MMINLVCTHLKDEDAPVMTSAFMSDDRVLELKSDPWFVRRFDITVIPWDEIPDSLKTMAMKYERVWSNERMSE